MPRCIGMSTINAYCADKAWNWLDKCSQIPVPPQLRPEHPNPLHRRPMLRFSMTRRGETPSGPYKKMLAACGGSCCELREGTVHAVRPAGRCSGKAFGLCRFAKADE